MEFFLSSLLCYGYICILTLFVKRCIRILTRRKIIFVKNGHQVDTQKLYRPRSSNFVFFRVRSRFVAFIPIVETRFFSLKSLIYVIFLLLPISRGQKCLVKNHIQTVVSHHLTDRRYKLNDAKPIIRQWNKFLNEIRNSA